MSRETAKFVSQKAAILLTLHKEVLHCMCVCLCSHPESATIADPAKHKLAQLNVWL